LEFEQSWTAVNVRPSDGSELWGDYDDEPPPEVSLVTRALADRWKPKKDELKSMQTSASLQALRWQAKVGGLAGYFEDQVAQIGSNNLPKELGQWVQNTSSIQRRREEWQSRDRDQSHALPEFGQQVSTQQSKLSILVEGEEGEDDVDFEVDACDFGNSGLDASEEVPRQCVSEELQSSLSRQHVSVSEELQSSVSEDWQASVEPNAFVQFKKSLGLDSEATEEDDAKDAQWQWQEDFEADKVLECLEVSVSKLEHDDDDKLKSDDDYDNLVVWAPDSGYKAAWDTIASIWGSIVSGAGMDNMVSGGFPQDQAICASANTGHGLIRGGF